jgi:hypothetical protein
VRDNLIYRVVHFSISKCTKNANGYRFRLTLFWQVGLCGTFRDGAHLIPPNCMLKQVSCTESKKTSAALRHRVPRLLCELLPEIIRWSALVQGQRRAVASDPARQRCSIVRRPFRWRYARWQYLSRLLVCRLEPLS